MMEEKQEGEVKRRGRREEGKGREGGGKGGGECRDGGERKRKEGDRKRERRREREVSKSGYRGQRKPGCPLQSSVSPFRKSSWHGEKLRAFSLIFHSVLISQRSWSAGSPSPWSEAQQVFKAPVLRAVG